MQWDRKIFMRTSTVSFFTLLAFGVFTNTEIFALNWNDPGVNPVMSISDRAWRDANTGRRISIKDMPKDGPPVAGTSTGTSTGKTTGTSSSTTKAKPIAKNDPKPTTTTTSTTGKSGKLNAAKGVLGKAAGVAGGALGAYGVYENTAGSHEHSAGNVVGGTLSGMVAGASIGSIIPAVGTGVGAAVGAAVGGVISGSQLFSETDCLQDPITKKFTCCNTQFNSGERQVPIGGYMFCEKNNANGTPFPGVRQCLQEGSATETSWWSGGAFKDDHWSAECSYKWCDTTPTTEQLGNPGIKFEPDTTNFCYKWSIDTSSTTTTTDTSTSTSTTGTTGTTGATGTTAGTAAGTTPSTPVSEPIHDAYTNLVNRIEQEMTELEQQCEIFNKNRESINYTSGGSTTTANAQNTIGTIVAQPTTTQPMIMAVPGAQVMQIAQPTTAAQTGTANATNTTAQTDSTTQTGTTNNTQLAATSTTNPPSTTTTATTTTK